MKSDEGSINVLNFGLTYTKHRKSYVKLSIHLGVSYQSGIAKTGVVATIGSGDNAIMLRADMDALPIHEEADVEFRSLHDGKMHACGHDCHTAILLGVAKILKEHETKLNGTVKLFFQPAEEGGAGGKQMSESGVMDSPKVKAGFALHMWPFLPTGMLVGRPGEFLAAVNSFKITVTGVGGHAGIPHLATNPISPATEIVSSLPSVLKNEFDALKPSVLTITSINTNESYNVIPSEATINGTVRTLDEQLKESIKKRITEVASLIAKSKGCEAKIESVEEDYPVTFNDPKLWDIVFENSKTLVGTENVTISPPFLGGEDFAFYGAYAPTCFLGVGCRNEEKGCVYGIHHPQFKVDEDAFYLGVASHLAFVQSVL